MVGILVSFWDGLFSGAMLVSGSVKYVTVKTYQILEILLWRNGITKQEKVHYTGWLIGILIMADDNPYITG